MGHCSSLRPSGSALLVVQHHHGADQIGPFGAARLFPVTEGAIGSVQPLAARGRGRIGRRPKSQELPRVAAAASVTAPGGRDVFLRAQNRRHKKEDEEAGHSETMHDLSAGLAGGTSGLYYRNSWTKRFPADGNDLP